MNNNDFLALAFKAVVDYFNSQGGFTDKKGQNTQDNGVVGWRGEKPPKKKQAFSINPIDENTDK